MCASVGELSGSCISQEATELEKWRETVQQETTQKESKFRQKQQQEIQALQQRLLAGKEEQKKQRQLDLER